MASNPTYVFMDLGTTKKKSSDNNNTTDMKITELSMVAVRRDRLLGDVHPLIPGTPAVPRVQLKLTLCFNPGTDLGYVAKPGGGFTSDDVRTDDLKAFDENCFQVIDNFLNILTEPVYFIAHQGFNFDFPILKRHMSKLHKSFSKDILCADTYFGFYDILEGKKYKPVDEPVDALGQEVAKVSLEDSASGSVDAVAPAGRRQANAEKNKNVDEPTVNTTDQKFAEASLEKDSALGSAHEDVVTGCRQANAEENKQVDESTVNTTDQKVAKSGLEKDSDKDSAALAVRRKANAMRITQLNGFPWGPRENKPEESYKLPDVHERVLEVKAEDAHKTEIDCQLMLRIAVKLSDKFVDWVDENHFSFNDHVTV